LRKVLFPTKLPATVTGEVHVEPPSKDRRISTSFGAWSSQLVRRASTITTVVPLAVVTTVGTR
jgi:hypothetical protein